MAKEVWVWAEQRQGRLMDVTLELLAKGDELSRRLGANLAAVLIGDEGEVSARELAFYGANRVYLVEDPRLRFYQSDVYANLLANLARTYQPEILLLGATTIGRDLSARVAAKLRTGLIAHCVDLYINEESRLAQVVPGLENTMLEFVCSRNPQMATAKPGIFPKPERDESRQGKIIRVTADIKEEDFRAQTIEMIEEKPAAMPPEAADIVVAGGWGLHSVGGFKPVEELAEILGAAIGGTRPAVDKGWIPEELLIGQSGKTVSPKLFVSIGASGAMHFTTGFLRSKVIFAVDQNPKAPIFEVADVGIVGDLRAILPPLLKELRGFVAEAQARH